MLKMMKDMIQTDSRALIIIVTLVTPGDLVGGNDWKL